MIKKVPASIEMGPFLFSDGQNSAQRSVRVLLPVPLFYVIEIVENNQQEDTFQSFGFANDNQLGAMRKTLQIKRNNYLIPPLDIGLLMAIPSDSSLQDIEAIKSVTDSLLKEKFDLKIEPTQIEGKTDDTRTAHLYDRTKAMLVSNDEKQTHELALKLNGVWMVLHFWDDQNVDLIEPRIAEAKDKLKEVGARFT